MILEDRFRTKVEAAMKFRGWSQSELARQMNVDRQFIFSYLKQGKSPGLDVVERFANAIGVEPGNLIDSHELQFLSDVRLTA